MICNFFDSDDLKQGLNVSEAKDMTCYERTQDMQWVGIVGLSTSRKAVMVASLLSIFQIPSIGTLSSSDELSDKTRYFLTIMKLIAGVMTIFHLNEKETVVLFQPQLHLSQRNTSINIHSWESINNSQIRRILW